MMYGAAFHSATDAWAVGEAQSATKPVLRPVIEHCDGRRWRLLANPRVPPMTALSSVAVAPDGEAWAVGTPLTATGSRVILHWTKRAWVTAAAPVTGGSVMLDGVTAVSPGNVWAVGTASARGGAYLRYALHWNGGRLASVAVPHPGEGSESWGFEAVTRTDHGDLLAVGSAGSATVGRALHGTWSGRRWTLSTGPHITQLNAVSFDGRRAIWAVGSETTSDQDIPAGRGGERMTDDLRRRFEQVYAVHRAAILGYALRRTGNADDAADVIAETFLTAWRRIDDIPAGADARPWCTGSPGGCLPTSAAVSSAERRWASGSGLSWRRRRTTASQRPAWRGWRSRCAASETATARSSRWPAGKACTQARSPSSSAVRATPPASACTAPGVGSPRRSMTAKTPSSPARIRENS